MASAELHKSGQRVKYVGISGKVDGPTGRVSRVCKAYVKVRWDDGHCDDVHPESITVVPRPPNSASDLTCGKRDRTDSQP